MHLIELGARDDAIIKELRIIVATTPSLVGHQDFLQPAPSPNPEEAIDRPNLSTAPAAGQDLPDPNPSSVLAQLDLLARAFDSPGD